MKTSVFYTVKDIIKIVFYVTFSVVFLIFLIDFFAQSQKLSINYTLFDAVHYVLLMTPSRLSIGVPIIMLVSSNLFIMHWKNNKEWLALQSLGCSSLYMLKIFITIGAIFGLLFFVIVEGVGPQFVFIAKKLRANSHNVFLNKDGIWWWSKHNNDFKLLNYKGLDGVVVFAVNQKNNQLDHVIRAKKAQFINGKWHLIKAHIDYVDAAGLSVDKDIVNIDWNLGESLLNSLSKTKRMMSLPMLWQLWHFTSNADNLFAFWYRLLLPLFNAGIFVLPFAGVHKSLYSKRNKLKVLVLAIVAVLLCLANFLTKFLVNILHLKTLGIVFLPWLLIVFLYARR